MAWGHSRWNPAPHVTDFHSAQRAAATKTYKRFTRSQIAHGALGSGTAAAQASAHKWFNHLEWQNKRNATVKAHKLERQRQLQAEREHFGKLLLGFNMFGTPTDPLGVLLNMYAKQTAEAKRNLGDPGSRAATLASLGKQRDLLWKLVGKEFGGKKPGLHIGTDPGTYGQVSTSHKNVTRIAEQLAQLATMGRNPRDRADLQSVLLHEWAHTRQPNRLFFNRHRAEGGAEARSRELRQKYHIGGYDARGYDAYVKWVRQHLGEDWIRKGQFQ